MDVDQLTKILSLVNLAIAIGGTVAQRGFEALAELEGLTGQTKDELLALSDDSDADTQAVINEMKARLAPAEPV